MALIFPSTFQIFLDENFNSSWQKRDIIGFFIHTYSCHVYINNLPYSDRYFNTDLQFEMLKEESQWTLYLFSAYFKIGFLNFNSICCWYTLELPHRGIEAIPMCTYSICPFNKWVFFTIKQVFHNFLNYFLCFSVISM